MKIFGQTLICAAIAVASGAAVAQTAVGKAYWGLEVGSSKVENETGSLTSSLVSNLGGSASATEDSNMSAFKILGGYKYSENIDFEGAYFKSSDVNLTFAGTSRNGTSYAGNAAMSVSGFEGSVNLRPSVASGFNNAYLKAGVHSLTSDTSLRLTSGSVSISNSSSQTGTGTLYGLGYDHPIGDGNSLRIQCVKYRDVAGESGSGGTVVSFGFLKQF